MIGNARLTSRGAFHLVGGELVDTLYEEPQHVSEEVTGEHANQGGI